MNADEKNVANILLSACIHLIDEESKSRLMQDLKYTTSLLQQVLRMRRFSLAPIPPNETNSAWSLGLTYNIAHASSFGEVTQFEHAVLDATISRFHVINTNGAFGTYKSNVFLLQKYKNLEQLLVENVYKIKDRAFFKSNFKHVKLRHVNIIGVRCFENCPRLCTVDLTEAHVSNIPAFAFRQCTLLSSVLFPKSRAFRRINKHAFSDCAALKKVEFDPIVYVDPTAFPKEVVLPEKKDYIPKVQIGTRVLNAETHLFGLYTVPIFDPLRNSVSFFAQNIQLCLDATENHAQNVTTWYLHIFKLARPLRLLTSPREFREGVYRMWEDSETTQETPEHLRVEKKLQTLCKVYNYDGWYARLQIDNWKKSRANQLTSSYYETAILKDVLADNVVKQIACIVVNRSEIRSATTAVLNNDGSVTIKNGRKTLVANSPNIMQTHANKTTSAFQHTSKRQRTELLSNVLINNFNNLNLRF